MADTTAQENRKPLPQASREPADVVLNRFLKEQKMVLAIRNGDIERTESGMLIIRPSNVVVQYQDEAMRKAPNEIVN